MKIWVPRTGMGVTALVLCSAIVGAFGLIALEWTYTRMDTNEFCLSCHNHDIPYAEHQNTVHFKNEFGVTPGCADCHVPNHNLLPRLIHKTFAAKELLAHFRGVINTEEKYLARRAEMREHELARMRESDSMACRNCHNVEHMDLEKQSRKAQRDHAKLGTSGKTCVDCHEEAGHAVPVEEESFDM